MKTSNKTVYIVTPSFNAAATIERTILSVVTQAGEFDIRYHVQDGGSNDGTLQILERWKDALGKKEFPIQCDSIQFSFDSSPDGGMYDALVKGFATIAIPASSFVAWINADDILMPGSFALVSKVATDFTSEQVSWLGGAVAVIRDDAPIVQYERPIPTRVIRDGMCDGKHWPFIQQEGVFFRHWLWKAVEPVSALKKYKLAGDWNLWRLFAHHAEFVQVPWPLGAFRLREGQLSQANGAAYMAEVEATVKSQSRLDALKYLGDSGGAVRRILKAHYPSGNLFVVEKSADDQAHFHYHKNFGRWPARPVDDKGGQGGRLLYEACAPALNETIPGGTSSNDALPPKPEHFNHYTYARRSHWKLFDNIDTELYGKKIHPDKEQLKFYQDLLVLRFIRDNVSPGSRILDVGGGISRILAHLAPNYECWNIDKLDGVGNGPRAVKDPPYRLVRDYMGNFNSELPDGYFDLVFSISALEHVPQHDSALFDSIINDINRVLKPGGLSLHLFDIVLKQKGMWNNKFTQYIFENVATINQPATEDEMRRDPDLYAMSEEAYNKTWLHTTKVPYAEHGLPSSLNILWRKSGGAVRETVTGDSEKSVPTVTAARELTFFVVTPCLNVAETIDRTMQSVVDQSGAFRIRYHVQDGGSTDGTIDKLRQWARKLKRPDSIVKCLGVEFTWASVRDKSMYEALSAGFDSLPMESDDILTWINGDDVIMPDAFATVARVCEAQPAIQWLGGTARVIDDNNCVVEERDMPVPTDVIREGLCDGRYWSHLQQEGIFFRKALWFKSKHALHGFRLAGDWSLWREFAHHSEYHQVGQALGAFRTRDGQLSVARLAEYESEIDAALPAGSRRSAFDRLYAQRHTLFCRVINASDVKPGAAVGQQAAVVFFDEAAKKVNG
jgi:glycosyltransferase involved in cell wall biosynthesis/ubiquinone/menaquinone biosynthesis C-methylase UbiE